MDKYTQLAMLIRRVAEEAGDERASKCGYDLMHALRDGTESHIAEAWRRYLEEKKRGDGHTDTTRNGVWVPAVPMDA